MMFSKKQILFFLFCLALCSSAWASDSGVAVLTRDQMSAIRSELTSIQSEVNLLRTLSARLQAESADWQKKCNLLEEKLMQSEAKLAEASQELGNSGRTLVELREQAGTLRHLLEELKSDYEALNQSYLRQKKTARFWRAAAVTAILISVGGGLAHFLSK